VDSTILSPLPGAVLTSQDKVTIRGGAFAIASLKSITATVNGSPLFADSWVKDVITNTTWSADWTPGGDGVYTLESQAMDWAGNIETQTHPVTVTVSTSLPSISLATSVYTTTQLIDGGLQIELAGSVSHAPGLVRVQVKPGDEGWQDASVQGDRWSFPWIAPRYDGANVPVVVRLIDQAGRISEVNRSIIIDTLPPQLEGDLSLLQETPPTPPSMGLAPASLTSQVGATQVITSGQTIYQANPTLEIHWKAARDGSGIQRYYAGWTESLYPTLADLSPVDPGGPLFSSKQTVGEAQVLYGHLAAEDLHGNLTWRSIGPVYIDGPTTPDLTQFRPAGSEAQPYSGWQASGSTEIGDSREILHGSYARSSLGSPQRFYATWDARALRLAWSGADWNSDGDLFIYLDSSSGGATMLYDPYAAGTGAQIAFPNGFEADSLVWVRDDQTATLLKWGANGWAADQKLASDQFHLQAVNTDLSLPFQLAGIDPGKPLSLLAVASEEGGLRLWAAAPDKNPLNSPRVLGALARQRIPNSFALTGFYQWPSLGSGALPNQGRFTDSDLQLTITANPPGLTAAYLESGLLDLLKPGTRLDANGDGAADASLPADTRLVPLGGSQAITYTLQYTNTGTAPALGVALQAQAYGALSFSSGSSLSVNLGDIAPGSGGTYTFNAITSAAGGSHSAEMDAAISDSAHGTYDWLWALHALDTDPPQGLTITGPLDYARPYTQTITGLVEDPSGVPNLNIEIQPQPSGDTVTLTCSNPTPDTGRWSCQWDPGNLTGLSGYRLRAQAIDRHGNASPWTDWITLVVDNTPPAVKLDAATQNAIAGGFLNAQTNPLTGQVIDNRQAVRLDACLQTGGQRAICTQYAVLPGDSPAGQWSINLPVQALDGITQTLTLTGYDRAGNASTPLALNLFIDDIPPVITATQLLQKIPLGAGETILSGTVTDGSGRLGDINVSLRGQDGKVTWQKAQRTGENWQFNPERPFAEPGQYLIGVEAYDQAGNHQTAGPFLLVVEGSSTTYMPLILNKDIPIR
jgi:hypothetical protein